LFHRIYFFHLYGVSEEIQNELGVLTYTLNTYMQEHSIETLMRVNIEGKAGVVTCISLNQKAWRPFSQDCELC
jgi:hypothetical protein